jgi:hypothetical protein
MFGFAALRKFLGYHVEDIVEFALRYKPARLLAWQWLPGCATSMRRSGLLAALHAPE